MATERSLERCGVSQFDLLLLHNPDRTGYRSEAVWAGMEAVREAGLTRLLGVAPGPANGFTLDVIECFERFGAQIDWAMVILGPMEPWPGELVLAAAEAHGVQLITRVVDYGGLFHDDVSPEEDFAEYDHRRFRPAGWVRAGLEKLESMRPIADAHGLTMLQLACAWNLAQPAVACVAPTLIQERGAHARAIEDERAELTAVGLAHARAHARAAPRSGVDTGSDVDLSLRGEEVQAIRAIARNTRGRRPRTGGALTREARRWRSAGASTRGAISRGRRWRGRRRRHPPRRGPRQQAGVRRVRRAARRARRRRRRAAGRLRARRAAWGLR